MLISIEQANSLPSRVSGSMSRFARLLPFLSQSLEQAKLRIAPENYLAATVISAAMYGIIGGFLVLVLGIFSLGEINYHAFQWGVAGGTIAALASFGLHLIYPRIMAGQAVQGVDQGLMFALRSLQIQVSSGVSLYDAMANVARSNYGIISEEFERVVQDINAGVNESAALERMALRTDSPFLRKTIWQLVTSIRAGSPLSTALTSIMESLNEFRSRAIKNYAAELNLWILLYLLTAAALPTIGITFMVILSSIGGSDIQPETIFVTVGAAFVVQIVLIGLIGSRAPRGYA